MGAGQRFPSAGRLSAGAGDENDALRVEPVEALEGGELGIKHEMLRRLAVLAGPEFDEAEDLLGLLTLADVGVGVAEHLAVGILRQEGENAGLATAPFRQVMRLNEGMLAAIGHGVEVEIDGLTLEDRLAGELGVPTGEQPRDLLRGDARGVFREEAPFRHGVETTKEPKSLVGNQGHNVALALN